MFFLRFRWYCSPFWGRNPPQKTTLGLNRHIPTKWAKYWKFHINYQIHCIDFSQISHNDRDHQVVSQYMADGHHFEKKPIKSPYLCNRLTDFDEIWHGGAYLPLIVDLPLKFRIFENPRWRRPPSWKLQKLRYLCNGLTDLYEVWLMMQNGSLNHSDNNNNNNDNDRLTAFDPGQPG